MINNLSILTRPSMEAESNASDHDTILERVCSMYNTLVGDDSFKCDEDTIIAEHITPEQVKQFFNDISDEFGITISEDEELPDTIGALVGFIQQHQGETFADRLTHQWDSKAFADIQKKLDITLRMLDGYGESQEGVASGLLKVFIGTADLFLKVGNTFKTNLLKFFKSVKRSEIRYFVESHTFLCKAVEAQAITKVMNTEIPVPTGMIGSYKNTVDYIEQVYDTVSLNSFANTLYKELMDIRRQMTRGEESYKRGFKPTADRTDRQTEVVRKVVALQSKFFTDKTQNGSTAFKSVFGSMQDLKDVRAKLIDMERYLGDTKALVDLVDNVDLCISDITNYLTEDSEVDKQFIEQLAKTVRFLATAFDVYGTCAMRQMALEHNLVLTYETLYKSI